jgi:SHS2 domain-containing protein
MENVLLQFLRQDEVGKKDRVKTYKKYEEIEHPSDIGLRFRGESLEELFANAGVGMFSLITQINRVENTRDIDIKLSSGSSSYEDLLILWLERLLYYFEVENFVFSRIKVLKVKSSGISAVLYGEKIDNTRHNILNSIKAPTYHMLSISKDSSRGIWEGTIIFDV